MHGMGGRVRSMDMAWAACGSLSILGLLEVAIKVVQNKRDVLLRSRNHL